MVYCCVTSCTSNFKIRRKRPECYGFPADPEKKIIWMRTLTSYGAELTEDSQICAKHFPEYMFRITKNRKYLCYDAYPALYYVNGKYTEVKLPINDLLILRQKRYSFPCNQESAAQIHAAVESEMEMMFSNTLKNEIKEEQSDPIINSDDSTVLYILDDKNGNGSECDGVLNDVQVNHITDTEWELADEEFEHTPNDNDTIQFVDTDKEQSTLYADNDVITKTVESFSRMCRVCMEISDNALEEITEECAEQFSMFINIPLIGSDSRLPRCLCSECGLAIRNIILLLGQCSTSLNTLSDILKQFDQINSKMNCKRHASLSKIQDDEAVQTDNADLDSAISDEGPVPSRSKRRSIIPCPVCNIEVYDGKAAYARHMRTHCPFICEVCNHVSSSWNDLLTHKAKTHPAMLPEESRLLCYICGAVFMHNSSFKSHLDRHSNSRNYLCTVCGKSFASSASLSLHGRIHSDIRPYKCSHCPKTFRQVPHCKRHELIRHSNDRPMKCEICGRGFAIRLYLRDHLYRIHRVGEPPSIKSKPGICNHCGKVLSSRHVLADHLNTQHAPDSLSPAETQLVARYSRKAIEKAEQMKYDCNICGKGLRDELSYTAHMRRHTGETPYRCDECNMEFSNEPNWRRHTKTHTRPRTQSLFPCPLCGLNFYTRSHRYKHMKMCESKLPMTDDHDDGDIEGESEDGQQISNGSYEKKVEFSDEAIKMEVAACEEIIAYSEDANEHGADLE